MSSPFIPIETADLIWRMGLPFSNQFDDIYFSSENGIEETVQVYIEGNDLLNRWAKLDPKKQSVFNIAELGFGTGLNFLSTWLYWQKQAPTNAKLYYFSCELHPLKYNDLARCFNLWPELEHLSTQLLASYPILTPGFHYLSFDQGRINLILMLGNADSMIHQLLSCGDRFLESQLGCTAIDAWYFDGFSPCKNTDMWSEDLFKTIALLSRPGTTAATFSAARMVKDNLLRTGFEIEKRKGFAQKRDMLVASFKGAQYNAGKKVTPWHAVKTNSTEKKKATIIGAGLAGCVTAYSLAKRGWEVVVVDQGSAPAQGASGNQQAILYPKLSAYKSPLTDFLLSAFLYATRFYTSFMSQVAIGELKGILQLAFEEKEKKSQSCLSSWLNSYPELGQIVNAEQATSLAGMTITANGLYIPLSGWIDCNSLCSHLMKSESVSFISETTIDKLEYKNGEWSINDHQTEVLIIANGHACTQFGETAFLPLKAIKGQMTWIKDQEQSRNLQLPLCGDCHVLPMLNHQHALGATYEPKFEHYRSTNDADALNLSNLDKLPVNTLWSKEIVRNWTGIRGAAPDYLPLVGPVPDAELFLQQFNRLADDSRRWLATEPAYLPNLYMISAFGSRGLTSIPLCAEWLAALINGEPSLLPRDLIRAITPSRFLIKKIIKSKKPVSSSSTN